MRTTLIVLMLACSAASALRAQTNPTAGSEYPVTYTPPADVHFAPGAPLQLVYAYNYWGTRSATRLALLENVLRPDSGREHRIPMERTDAGWKAVIPVAEAAAVLSYYITDGTVRDDNHERTYVYRVTGADGRPVRNASYFMTSFLQLAGAPVAERLREAEAETRAWPDNFRTYSQYFSLLLEQGRNGPEAVSKIVEVLDRLEKAYPDKEDFLNLAARTYFYLLRNTVKSQEYKERITPANMWPEVVTIFDREKVMAERAQVSAERAATRSKLLSAPLPDVTLVDLNATHRALRAEQGKVLVIFFWSVESSNSRKLIAPMRRLQEKYGTQGMRVIDVNLDPEPETARNFVPTADMPFEHRLNNGDALVRLGIDTIPVVMVVDAQRMVRLISTGYGDDVGPKVENSVKSLLPGE